MRVLNHYAGMMDDPPSPRSLPHQLTCASLAPRATRAGRWNPALGFKYEEMRLEAGFDAVRRDAMERLPAMPFC